MFGSDIGSLSVYQDWNKTEKQLLWTKNTSDENDWTTTWFDVESNEPFYVSINFIRFKSNLNSYIIFMDSDCLRGL